jgi:predicted nuclease of predicted toxin-antitoxin system
LRLLADENVHGLVIRRLREAGLEVEAVAEQNPGATDREILERPDIETLILITYDSDFGELIFKHRMPAPAAVIYSRLGRAEPRFVADEIIQLIRQPINTATFNVITKEGVRTRPLLPGTKEDG